MYWLDYGTEKKDLNNKLKEARTKQPNLRYQIKVGKTDLTLRTKMVGEFKWLTTPIQEYLPDKVSSLLVRDIRSVDSPIIRRNPKRTSSNISTSPSTATKKNKPETET